MSQQIDKKWLKNSGLRAVGTAIDSLAGLLAANATGLLDLSVSAVAAAVGAAVLFCIGRSLSKVIDGG